MGYSDIKECIFTGLNANAIIDSLAFTEYNVTVNEKSHLIRYKYLDVSDPYFIENKDLFIGLLHNGDWFEDESELITIEKLQDLVKNKILPLTPEEKFTNLFIKLFSLQKEDGQWIRYG